MINLHLDNNKIILETDEYIIKSLLEFRREITTYSPFKKTLVTYPVIEKLYENTRNYKNKNNYFFVLGQGWIPYLLAILKNKLSNEKYNWLSSLMLSPYYRTIPFPGLRDYQNEDVLYMLKYRRGILQVTTGYGKTQCLAELMNYFHNELGENVLVITPGSKPRDEIIKRYNSLFGKKIPIGIDEPMSCIMTTGFLNRKCMKDPSLIKLEEEKLKKYTVVLGDEIEYTCGNKSGKWIYDHLVNAKVFYGVSGTASKKDAKMITFAKGITDVILDNKDLVSVYGSALVYRLPTNITVDRITIHTETLDKLSFTKEDFSQDSNVYLNVLTKIWTNPEVCKLIIRIIKKYPKIFIGINDLNTVINEWIHNYFIPEKLRTLLICYDGYIYYDENGNSKGLTLEEAEKYVKNGLVDVIPSTASGFRGLDFSSLQNVLLVVGNLASQVCQIAGRASRGTYMRILSIINKSGKGIPCYTKGLNKRDELISSYYKFCTINKIDIDGDLL